jgi:hypothetical protein
VETEEVIEFYLEGLRRECEQALLERHEQGQAAIIQCAKIRDLISEMEEVYIALLNRRAEMISRRGKLADEFASKGHY